jgi:hypothetical protein
LAQSGVTGEVYRTDPGWVKRKLPEGLREIPGGETLVYSRSPPRIRVSKV